MAGPNPKRNISTWWADNPMTYGSTHGRTDYAGVEKAPELGSLEFFRNVDQVFYSWNTPLHSERPFGRLFPYERFAGKRVLEVGCGMGTMAMNWAQSGAVMTAVDLNRTAVRQTKRRFELLGLDGGIVQVDGNVLPFETGSFDFAYSFGVLHHSPDLDRSLKELVRVVRPGGEFGGMLYARTSIEYWYDILFVEGFLHGERFFLNPLALASRYTDGARDEGNPHTWPVTESEIREMLGDGVTELKLRRLGTELDYYLPLMLRLPKLNSWLPAAFRKPLARRWGWSIWFQATKRA